MISTHVLTHNSKTESEVLISCGLITEYFIKYIPLDSAEDVYKRQRQWPAAGRLWACRGLVI